MQHRTLNATVCVVSLMATDRHCVLSILPVVHSPYTRSKIFRILSSTGYKRNTYCFAKAARRYSVAVEQRRIAVPKPWRRTAPRVGLEPTTHALTERRSTVELPGNA